MHCWIAYLQQVTTTTTQTTTTMAADLISSHGTQQDSAQNMRRSFCTNLLCAPTKCSAMQCSSVTCRNNKCYWNTISSACIGLLSHQQRTIHTDYTQLQGRC
mmetsp:Transcript_23968/g.52452  ORF Transcript_23968/g.52452 Transcript_23968/m.52452 type:complete len:102 (-) Transcript_23968:476-781(-)